MQQLLRIYKISIPKTLGWKCLHIFIYFTNTQAYQTESLREGLEKCFKRNEGNVCTKVASYCVSSEIALSRNAITQQSNTKWKTRSMYTVFVYGSSLNFDVYFNFQGTFKTGISLIE